MHVERDGKDGKKKNREHPLLAPLMPACLFSHLPASQQTHEHFVIPTKTKQDYLTLHSRWSSPWHNSRLFLRIHTQSVDLRPASRPDAITSPSPTSRCRYPARNLGKITQPENPSRASPKSGKDRHLQPTAPALPAHPPQQIPITHTQASQV